MTFLVLFSDLLPLRKRGGVSLNNHDDCSLLLKKHRDYPPRACLNRAPIRRELSRRPVFRFDVA